MIKFELLDKEIIEIPKVKADKLTFFKGIEGMKSEDCYDFSHLNRDTLFILFNYLNDEELSQKDILENEEEIFDLADYLGDEKFLYAIKKQSVLAKSKVFMMILKEYYFQLIEDECMDVKEMIEKSEEFVENKLNNIFNECNYEYERVIDETFSAFIKSYGFYFQFQKCEISTQRKMVILEKIEEHIIHKDGLKIKFLQSLQKECPFGFEKDLTKESAYYIYKRLCFTIAKKIPYACFGKRYIIENKENCPEIIENIHFLSKINSTINSFSF